jgi:hypothetical protein
MRRILDRILLSLLIVVLFSIVTFSYTGSSVLNAQAKTSSNDNNIASNDVIVPIQGNNILGNIAKQFGTLTKQFTEYIVNLDGKQIFRNETIKQNIVTDYKPADYNISRLNYPLLGFNINASDIKIHIIPSRIDETSTKVDFPLLLARNVNVTNGLINMKYHEINLGGIYGIYNKNTDKMTLHIPISTALRYLPHP